MGKLDIAREYLHAPTYTLEAVDAFKALAKECARLRSRLGQYISPVLTIAARLDISEMSESEPYHGIGDMTYDIERGRFKVSNLNSVHPQWTIQQNIDFRVVHDVLGHYMAKTGFSWKGELAAYKSQARWHSPLAAEALYTEIVGQTACYSVDKVFPAQKVILLESRNDSIELL